ncbi:hypothetical protein AX17_004988 [Amanita inopinata Kibby_2008]|nr:hypothetical protein AX17_004988 [Amanita inopinata Kibby_2008]
MGIGESALGVREQTYASLVSLTIQVWDLLICFSDEVEYLWPIKFTATKVLYLWSRYLALAAQIMNVVSTHLLYSKYFELRNCNNLNILRVLMAQQAVTCIELIALMRVYVLYNKSSRIGILLLLVFITEFSFEFIGVSMRVKALSLGTSCVPSKIGGTDGIMLLWMHSVGMGLNQCVVMSLIVAKIMLARSVGWGRTPLASLMMRDGFALFLLISVTLSGVVGSSFVRLLDALQYVRIPLFVALVSATGCRLLLSMCNLTKPLREKQLEDGSVPVLTTNIGIHTSD